MLREVSRNPTTANQHLMMKKYKQWTTHSHAQASSRIVLVFANTMPTRRGPSKRYGTLLLNAHRLREHLNVTLPLHRIDGKQNAVLPLQQRDSKHQHEPYHAKKKRIQHTNSTPFHKDVHLVPTTKSYTPHVFYHHPTWKPENDARIISFLPRKKQNNLSFHRGAYQSHTPYHNALTSDGSIPTTAPPPKNTRIKLNKRSPQNKQATTLNQK